MTHTRYAFVKANWQVDAGESPDGRVRKPPLDALASGDARAAFAA